MKRFLAALLAALTVFTLTGCGKTENPAEPVTPGQGEEPAAPTEPELTPEEIAEQERLAAEKAREERLQGLLDSMTLEEKVGQLFFVRCPETNAVEDISTYHLGGYLLFGRDYKDGDNWLTWEQFIQKIESYQDAAAIPLFIGSDEEGGTVSRIGANEALGGTKVADMRSFGQSADPAQVYAAGQTLAANLTGLGFNLDFAPDCDVVSGVDSVIGSRSFGSDPELCASLAGVIVKSLRAEGVVSCLKHFPGYGSATVDDHNGTSIVEKTLDELESCDLVPFQSIIAQEGSVPFVMVTHLSYPNVTGSDTPADLSSAIVTGILRDKLGYQNVIITDSQSMSSITDHYSAGEAAVQALAAGCDMILMPSDLQGAFDAVKAAVADGTLTQSRIEESVLRILTVKAEYGILQ